MALYTNETKKWSRNTHWNNIAKRLRKVKDPLVLVLAGDAAGDVKQAEKHNLRCVGVDKNKECVSNFRNAGGVAIQDDLSNQIAALRPDAVIADFTGGFTASNSGIIVDAVIACRVVVCNMLRGRDPFMVNGNVIKHNPEYMVPSYNTRKLRFEECGKHRGKIAYLYLQAWMLKCWYSATESDLNGIKAKQSTALLSKNTKPIFYSYQSEDSKQYFDSFIISTGAMTVSPMPKTDLIAVIGKKSFRKAAAAKAILTKKGI